MVNKSSESKQRYSLRKYKGIGAASVLLGALAITHPALAADPAPTEATATEDTNSTTENNDAKKYEADSGVRDNNDGTSTIYNRDASYTLPTENIVKDKTREPGYVDKYGRHVYEYNEEEYNKYNEQGEKLAKEQYAENKKKETNGSEDFKDTTVKYVTKDGDKEVEIKSATVEDTDGKASYKVNGRFGKKYIGTDAASDTSKIKADDVIKKGEKVYHKIDTVVVKGDGTATKTKLNDVELNITPKGLHKEDGSIDYSKIKDRARIFLVTETDEGKYDKYLVINKDNNTNDTSITDLFKAQAANAKTFDVKTLKENNEEIKDGDIVLVVEKNEFAVLPDKEKKRERSYTTLWIMFGIKELDDFFKYDTYAYHEVPDLAGVISNYIPHEVDTTYDRFFKREKYGTNWKEYYPDSMLNNVGKVSNTLDMNGRLIYGSQSEFYGEIGKGDKISTYDNLNKFVEDLIKEYGPTVKKTDWDTKRDRFEAKFVENLDDYDYENIVNYNIVKNEIAALQKEREKIEYVDKFPDGAKFVKNVYEFNIAFEVGYGRYANNEEYFKKYFPGNNKEYIQLIGYNLAAIKYNEWSNNYWREHGPMNLGTYYQEYEKDGQIYRVAKALLQDQGGILDSKSLEVHYYDLYTPLRAYTVNSKANEVKNIYAEEESKDVVKKGDVVVHYKTADGTEIKDAATLKLADNVVSRGTSKYYVDKNGKEVILSPIASSGTVATNAKYDASSLKAARIQLDNGKVYKLAANQTATDSGVLKEGITDITYIYELAKGDVTVKYEDASGNSLADDVKVFTQADSGTAYNTSANKKDRILKDNKVYKFAKIKTGSAAENGKVSDVPAIVTYVYSEVSPKVDENVANKLGTVIVKYVDDKGEKIGEETVSKDVVVEKGTQTSYEGYPDLTKLTYEKTKAQYSTSTAKKDSLVVNGHTYNFKKSLSKEEATKYLATGEVATDVEVGTLAEGTTVLVYQYDYLIDVNVPNTPNNPTDPNTSNTPTDPTSKVPDDPQNRSYKDLNLIRDVKRTISYVYANGPRKGEKASDDVTQSARFVRSAKINRATGEVVSHGEWTPAQTFAKVESKGIAGYDVDIKEVEALEVKEGSEDVSVVVNYKAQQAGKVVVKYLIEGTDTAIKDEISKTYDFVGDEYEVSAPATYEIIKKDGKEYIYKGHREASAPEKGQVTKEDKVVIYDYKEFKDAIPGHKDNGLEDSGEVPTNEVTALQTTRHLIEGTIENIADPEVGYTERKEGVINHGDKRYFFDRTEEKDDIRTHYYKEFKDAIPGHKDNGLEDSGEVPTNEVGVLATTRHLIEGTTTNLFDPEAGTVANKADGETRLVEKDGKEYYYVNTVQDEENAITTHYYRLVVTKVPEAPSEDELPILKTTRHLIEGTTTDIVSPELGTTEHKTGVLEYEGKNYQFSRTEAEDKNGITTHYYRLVVTKVPEAPSEDELPILKTTRHLIEGTTTNIADVELGYTEHKDGKLTFEGKDYEYVSTEEKDNIRTHYYKEVKKVITPTPEGPQENPSEPQSPHENPSEPQGPQDNPNEPQNRPEVPQENPSDVQNNPQNPVNEEQNRPQQGQQNSNEGRNIEQRQLPKTSAANNVATLGLGLVALAGLALRRKIK